MTHSKKLKRSFFLKAITFPVDIKKVASKSTTKVGMKHIMTVVKKDMAMVAVTTIMRKKRRSKVKSQKVKDNNNAKEFCILGKFSLGLLFLLGKY